MADYGAKGTISGYDVRTAPDYLQNFNSSFPLLKTHATGVSSSTVNHDLGYFPLHIMADVIQPGGIDQFAHDQWSVSETQLVRSSGSGNRRYYIFRQSLTDDFTAPTIDGSGSQGATDADYGFKLSLPGRSAQSSDLRDFSLHSGARSPAIHMVRHATMIASGGDYWYELSYNLPYTPVVLVYMRPGANFFGLSQDRYGIVMPPIGVSGRWFMVDEGTGGRGGVGKVLVYAGSLDFYAPPQVSVVVLKDPFIKEVIGVTY